MTLDESIIMAVNDLREAYRWTDDDVETEQLILSAAIRRVADAYNVTLEEVVGIYHQVAVNYVDELLVGADPDDPDSLGDAIRFAAMRYSLSESMMSDAWCESKYC